MKRKLKIIFRWILASTIMFVAGTVSLLIVILSLGTLRNFCVRYIIKYSSRFILRAAGYKIVMPGKNAFPSHKVLYTINHNSYLDLFLLTAAGLADTRYILSEKTLKYVHLTISALATGTFYIPVKRHETRRLHFFLKMTSRLKKKKYSIIASPEGVSPYIHGVNPFNKGIFHMAMEAGIPIVPLYIHIPEKLNPYKGEYSASGTIRLEVLNEIDNSDWTLENISEHIAVVRNVYVDRFNTLNNTNIL